MKNLLLLFVLLGSSTLVFAENPEHVVRLHQAIETRQAVVEEAAQTEDLEVKKSMEAQARQEFWQAVNSIYQAAPEPVVAPEPVIIPEPVPQNSIEKAFGAFWRLFR